MEITWRAVGKADGYEHYHNEYFLDGEIVGRSSYDKNQRLDVGVLEDRTLSKKNIYAGSPEGFARKIEKLLETSQPKSNT